MYAVLGLPSLTGSCARGAKSHGDFGLVWWALTNRYHDRVCAGGRFLVGLDPVTILYHSPDLGQGQPRVTFTNLYHRDEGTRYGLTYGLRWPASGIRAQGGQGYRCR